MKELHILFLQPDYSRYKTAYYQQQFYVALGKTCQIFPYGPGYSEYAADHTIQDVLQLCPFEPNLICFGAGWENDTHPTVFNPHPAINVAKIGIPSVMILNKEYKKLDQKFQFILDNRIQIVFTAHHHFALWEEQLKVRFVHFPFAVDPELFRDYGMPKQIDIGFAGSLHAQWTEVRARIKRHIFWSGALKKPRYWRSRLYWREWDKGLKTDEDYARLINSSHIWLSTPSAIDLVGQRFYEIMAVKSLLFCSRSPVYEGLFQDGQHCIMFEPDLSDFDDKFFYYRNHPKERQAIIERGYRHVLENHTWEKRIDQFTNLVSLLV
jgi:hypothetical protein